MNEAKVNIKDAAKELQMDVLTLRYLMQQNRIDIGYAVKREGHVRYAYYIYRGKLDEAKKQLGII